jgi:hypothetical protein
MLDLSKNKKFKDVFLIFQKTKKFKDVFFCVKENILGY